MAESLRRNAGRIHERYRHALRSVIRHHTPFQFDRLAVWRLETDGCDFVHANTDIGIVLYDNP